MRDRLRIGKIPYLNLFPVFRVLQRDCDCSAYDFIEGVPSQVNRMLRSGEIDVSPSSSIEYLRNPSLYEIVEGHSISSRGPIGSILLFSRRDIADLGGVNITVTAQSETSIGLLAVVLTQFFGIEPPLEISQRPERSDADAFLLIGDDALRQRRMIADTGETVERSCRDLRVYDLGEIWFERTGLPFVFALWIARRDVTRETGPIRDLYERFLADMERAGRTIPVDFELLAAEAPLREYMEESEIVSYWRQIDYGLTHENRKGLRLFKEFLDRIGYL